MALEDEKRAHMKEKLNSKEIKESLGKLELENSEIRGNMKQIEL